MFGIPSEMRMPSTVVGIDRNVLRTERASMPGSNGVYSLGSHVSVCACPPAIQSRIMASALGSILGAVSSARATAGMPSAAAAPTAQPAPRNRRRLQGPFIRFEKLRIVLILNALLGGELI